MATIKELLEKQQPGLAVPYQALLESAQQLEANGRFSMQQLFQELSLYNQKAQVNYDTSNDAEYPVPLHSHSFYEILFVQKGGVDYLLGNQRYKLQEGDLVLIPPGISHRPLFLNREKQVYARFALWVDADYFAQACQQYPDVGDVLTRRIAQGKYLLRTTQATWRGIGMTFEMLHRENTEQKVGWQLCLASATLALLAHIGRTVYYQDNVEPRAESNMLVDTMFGYIDTHLKENLSLEEMAKVFLVSKSTVSHLFQQKMGVSFYRCVIQRRLIAAKNSMLQGVAFRQVAEDCGFADYSSFFRLFKKEYGLSPREFVQLHKTR